MRSIAVTFVAVLALSCGARPVEIASDTLAIDDAAVGWMRRRACVECTRVARAAAVNARNLTDISSIWCWRSSWRVPCRSRRATRRELLSRIYVRSGQYRRLLANLDAWERDFPNDDDVRKEKADVEQFRGLPDQQNGQEVAATLPHDAGNDFSAPVFDQRAAGDVSARYRRVAVGDERAGGETPRADHSRGNSLAERAHRPRRHRSMAVAQDVQCSEP